MKTALLVLFATPLLSVGDTFLSSGMRHVGSRDVWSLGGFLAWIAVVATPMSVLLGVLFQCAFFLLFLVALSRADLSYVLPITAASYIFTALLAKAYLKEQISPLRWSGILVIVMGIVLVMLDGNRPAAVNGVDG